MSLAPYVFRQKMNQPTFELSDSIRNDLLLFNQPKSTVSVEAIEKLLHSACDDIAKIQILGDSVTSLKRLEGKLTLSRLPIFISCLNKCMLFLTEEKLMKNIGPQNLAIMYSSLSTFLIEAASHKLPLNAAEGILNKCNWSPEQIKVVTKVYPEQVTNLRTALKMIGERPPRIVDVNWRLDYQVEVINLENFMSTKLISSLYYSPSLKVP